LDEYNTVKLADFGLANLMRDGKAMKTDCGSPNYVAPEVLSRRYLPVLYVLKEKLDDIVETRQIFGVVGLFYLYC